MITVKQKEGIKTLCDGENILFIGGKRAGKTWVILRFLAIACNKYKDLRVLIVRKRFTDCKAAIWLQAFPEVLPTLIEGDHKYYHLDRSNFIIKFNTGSEIWVSGLDNKERAEKIFGQEYNIIFINEAVQITAKDNARLESILSKTAHRISDNKMFRNRIIYDSNPHVRANWLYKRFYKDKREGDLILNFSPYDNQENLPSEYIEKRLETLTGAERQRYLLGEWVTLEGCIYSHIKEENILEDYLNPVKMNFDDVVGGVDFGYWTVWVLFGIKEDRAYVITYDEIENKTTHDLIERIKSFKIKGVDMSNVIYYCDHEPDRILEMNQAGLYAKEATKQKAGDGGGYDSVRSFELYFNPHCERVFETLQSLMRKEDQFGNYIEDHVKNDDHLPDAVRYALHTWRIENSGINEGIDSLGGGIGERMDF